MAIEGENEISTIVKEAERAVIEKQIEKVRSVLVENIEERKLGTRRMKEINDGIKVSAGRIQALQNELKEI